MTCRVFVFPAGCDTGGMANLSIIYLCFEYKQQTEEPCYLTEHTPFKEADNVEDFCIQHNHRVPQIKDTRTRTIILAVFSLNVWKCCCVVRGDYTTQSFFQTDFSFGELKPSSDSVCILHILGNMQLNIGAVIWRCVTNIERVLNKIYKIYILYIYIIK